MWNDPQKMWLYTKYIKSIFLSKAIIFPCNMYHCHVQPHTCFWKAYTPLIQISHFILIWSLHLMHTNITLVCRKPTSHSFKYHTLRSLHLKHTNITLIYIKPTPHSFYHKHLTIFALWSDRTLLIVPFPNHE